MMKHAIAVFAATFLLGSAAHAYQVTGPVLEVSDTKIVVDKAGERHEIARDKSTKGDKNIKKGDKVTVQYNMTATSIESKEAKTPPKK